MDLHMSLVRDHGELSWSDSHSTASEDSASAVPPDSSPHWAINTTSTTRLTAGQLSPISTGMDIPHVDSTSSMSQLLHSASSSVGSWSTTYSDGEADDVDQDIHWEQGSDLAAPKLEPLEDDDFQMEDVQEAPHTPRPASPEVAASMTQLQAGPFPKLKRPRGRPRKHPLTPHGLKDPHRSTFTPGKRVKTGCITCRKRKKKCDEAKPRCMNCEKNAVVCEGYNEKTLWKSGKERAEEARQGRQPLPQITMQPIFQGVETPEDMVFLDHFVHHLSGVLTVEGQHRNAFKDMLLQKAVENQGLMHSVLSLSSRHIEYDTPYGSRLLASNSKVTVSSLHSRSEYHYEQAMKKLYEDIEMEGHKQAGQPNLDLSVRYGQMLCFLLQSVAEGRHSGEHRLHLQAYKSLIEHSPPTDSAFLVFITEYFQFHVFADELIRFPDLTTPRLASEDWEPWMPIQPARLLGIADGFFKHLSEITTIRNSVRTNLLAQIDPVVDYTSLYRAAQIDAAIREWTSEWPSGDSREGVALLYKQTMWVYLFRTIYPPTSSSPSAMAANAATAREVSPPLSPTSPANPTFDPHLRVHPARGGHAHNPAHRAGSVVREASPSVVRYPPHHDARISIAVDESLAILESFKPSDPCQTLLLVPCLVIGCAAFAPVQREKVRMAIRAVRGYTGMRNADRVLELVEEIWRLMEKAEWSQVWDWQGVAKSMNLDISCV